MVLHQKLVILEQLLQQHQMAGLILPHHVPYHKIDPLRHIDLEKQVIPDQLVDHLVDRVIQLLEFLQLVLLLFEDVVRLPLLRRIIFVLGFILILLIFMHEV